MPRRKSTVSSSSRARVRPDDDDGYESPIISSMPPPVNGLCGFCAELRCVAHMSSAVAEERLEEDEEDEEEDDEPK